jgi:uncharacterized damage-inducible protein DinB
MQTLDMLFRYNAWANNRVFEVVSQLDAATLGQDAQGTVGSIGETLKHMVGVEEVYLAMLRGSRPDSAGSREAYFAHDLSWFAQRSAELGGRYVELVREMDEVAARRPLSVPWLDVPLTAQDGLVQVLTHSAHHRAQVFSTLGERGQRVPDLDYVLMLQEAKA